MEPSLHDAEATTSLVATCGGEYVCLLDCSSGHVMQRFHQPQQVSEEVTIILFLQKSLFQNYSCLAWTTLTAENEGRTIKQNILAAGGKRGRIELFLPIQHLWYGSFGTDRPNKVMGAQEYVINCLRFHREEPQWLFAGGSDGTIELWNIGVPDNETMKADFK
jgi:WD40 repeat protein